ncbi:MAG: hypothetical protein N2507_06475 [Candidatus Bipolaricaulota bacterium]|nr:hypothetical protein [Candidatus Bipolaricaulota bacterium]
MRKLCVSLLVAGVLGVAQEVPPGVDAASFARIGIGGWPLALGGAYVALAEGPTAGYWNPAGLARLARFAVEGMYTNWLGAGIHYQHVGLAGYPPLGEVRPQLTLRGIPLTFALNWLSVMVPDIPWIEEGGEAGTFTAWSHLFFLSVGGPLSEALALGATLKVYHDRILEGVSLGVGADLGLLWETRVAEQKLRLGLVTTDIGSSRIQWYGTTGEPVNYVPWLVKAGVALLLWEERVILAAAAERAVDRPRFERVRLGAGVQVEFVSLGVGWSQPLYDEPARWSAGLRAQPLPWLTLEYAFLPSPLGDSHWLSLRLSF